MKRIHQSYGFPSDYAFNFPDYIISQSYGNDQQMCSAPPVGLPNQSSTRENVGQSSRIRSPASDSYAAHQHFMGLSESQNCISYQQSAGDSLLGGGSLFNESDIHSGGGVITAQTPNRPYVTHEGSFRNPVLPSFSETDVLQHLLDGLDVSDTKGPPLLFDVNHSLSVAQDLYASHFPHVKPFGSPGAGSSGKNRIRWTQDLHNRFVECVNQLGGPERATPKAIAKMMEPEGLTVLQVKSHLQKYRNAKESGEGKSEKKNSTTIMSGLDIKTGRQLKETLQMQLDVQKRLYEQLENETELLMRIEEQGEQLKKMFDQQRKMDQSPVMETRSSSGDYRCPNNMIYSSTTVEDDDTDEVLIAEGSDDDYDMGFPPIFS